MKKIIFGLIVIVGVVVMLNLFQHPQEDAANDKPTIKIGIIAPLVGDYQVVGELAKKTIEIFKDELKEKNLKNNYTFILEPTDALDIKYASKSARKLASVDNVDIIISYWNIPGIVTSEVIKGKNIIHINLGNAEENLKNGSNNFNFAPYAENQVRTSLEHISKLGYKNLAILGQNNQWSTSLVNKYAELSQTYGINIVALETINLGTKDLSLTLQSMESKSPDIYSFVLESPDFEIARKKMLEQNIQKPLTAIEATEYTDQPELFEGTWFVGLPVGGKEVVSKIKGISDIENTYNVTYIYDIATLVINAAEKSENKDEIIKQLQNIKNFNGASGEVIQDNNFFKTTDVIKKIENGKKVIIKE